MQKTVSIVVLLWFGILSGCVSYKPHPPTPILTASGISGWAVYSEPVSSDPFVTQIFLKNIGTGEIEQLTDSGNNGWPRWSPDGSQIVFTGWTEENSFDIYLMDKDGSHQRTIVASPASENLPEWSPDGSKIAFVSNEDGNSEIYILDFATQVIKKLTNSSEFATLPTWSDSGKYIAFESSSGGVGRSQIFVMNADGTNAKQLTSYDIDNFDGSPVWCPDDSCIVFTRFVEGVPKLMLLDLANSEVKPFLGDVFSSSIMEVRPSRSPSRLYITFSVGGTFYAINMKSGEIHPLDTEALDLSLHP